MRTLYHRKLKPYFLVFFIALILVPSFKGLYAQEDCDECSYPRVALYDFAVKVPRPTQLDSIKTWWNLFMAASYARGHIFNQYPPGSCITFLNGAMINAKENQHDTLRFGSEYTNLPPAGALSSADYLITGEINSTSGGYSVLLSLEAAYSREVVATGYATFSNSDPSGPGNAGIDAAQQISPLLKTIKDFERKKRDTDTKVAIKDLWKKDPPPDIILTPAQKDADANQKVDVEIKLIDCDGVPLKNREILLIGGEFEGMKLEASVNGKFASAKAITDENGIAKAQFIAGDKEGLAILYAYFKHQKPNGKNACFMGSSYVNVKKAPVRYYILNANVSETKNFQRDTSWSVSFGEFSMTGQYSDNEDVEYNASITAVLENQSQEAGIFYFNTGDPPVAINGSGSMSESAYSKEIEKVNGYISSGDIRSTSISGHPLIDLVRIEAVLESSEDLFNITVPFTRKGVYIGHIHGSDGEGAAPGWQPYDGEYDDSIAGVSAGVYGNKGVYVKQSEKGYSINHTESETIRESTSRGTATVRTLLSLNATLVPYDKLTDVEKASVLAAIPEKYSLEQNYPNPFNPSTRIRYHLPERSFVSLKVYDILGNEIITLVNREVPAGIHSVQFQAGNLPSGMYLYRMQAGNYSETRKLMLVK